MNLSIMLSKNLTKENRTKPFYTWEDILHFNTFSATHLVIPILCSRLRPRHSNTYSITLFCRLFLSLLFKYSRVILNDNPVLYHACRLSLDFLCNVIRTALIPSPNHEDEAQWDSQPSFIFQPENEPFSLLPRESF